MPENSDTRLQWVYKAEHQDLFNITNPFLPLIFFEVGYLNIIIVVDQAGFLEIIEELHESDWNGYEENSLKQISIFLHLVRTPPLSFFSTGSFLTVFQISGGYRKQTSFSSLPNALLANFKCAFTSEFTISSISSIERIDFFVSSVD